MVLSMTEALRESHPTADIKIEYLDAKNFSGPAHDKLVLDTLRSFRAVPDVVTITERVSGQFPEVNDAFTRITGYTAQEIIGRNAMDVGIWAAAYKREDVLATLSTEKRLINHETVCRRKSGEVFPALMSVEELTIDGKPCLLISARDITEPIRVDSALKESQHFINRVLETTPNFTYSLRFMTRWPI